MFSPMNQRAHRLNVHVLLICIFQSHLPLFRTQWQPQNEGTLRTTTHEVTMGRMALFLGGFLVLTILIGALATIPPP
jgi:hypothetical protein